MSTYAYPNPQAIFYQQYEAVRRDEVVGMLLALFLGTFGLHHFYLRRTGLGILYACFFWTGIPGISVSSSASSCPAACASSTPCRRRALRRRWEFRCRCGAAGQRDGERAASAPPMAATQPVRLVRVREVPVRECGGCAVLRGVRGGAH